MGDHKRQVERPWQNYHEGKPLTHVHPSAHWYLAHQFVPHEVWQAWKRLDDWADLDHSEKWHFVKLHNRDGPQFHEIQNRMSSMTHVSTYQHPSNNRGVEQNTDLDNVGAQLRATDNKQRRFV